MKKSSKVCTSVGCESMRMPPFLSDLEVSTGSNSSLDAACFSPELPPLLLPPQAASRAEPKAAAPVVTRARRRLRRWLRALDQYPLDKRDLPRIPCASLCSAHHKASLVISYQSVPGPG